MTILRAFVLEPIATEAHEVAKPPQIGVPGMLDKGGEPRRQGLGQALRARRAERASQQQRAGVVVDAIAVQPVGNRMDRMLEQSGVVAHRQKMIDLHRPGQAGPGRYLTGPRGASEPTAAPHRRACAWLGAAYRP